MRPNATPVSSHTVTMAFLERFLLKGQMLLKNLFFLAPQHFFSIKRLLETALELAESCWFSTACWVTPEIRPSRWRQVGSEEDRVFQMGQKCLQQKETSLSVIQPRDGRDLPTSSSSTCGECHPRSPGSMFPAEIEEHSLKRLWGLISPGTQRLLLITLDRETRRGELRGQ